jgi:DNA-binding CsgD family transcriptional regulator
MGRRGRPPYPDLLTPRQQEVLELVREGLTNREIAERLDITLDGAKFHVSEILTKIGVGSREEAARWQAETPTARLYGGRPYGAAGAWYSRWRRPNAGTRIKRGQRRAHAQGRLTCRVRNQIADRKLSLT